MEDRVIENRKPLLDVLSRKPAERRPVWFMRQAGRYLPEYRAVREKAGSFLDLCYNPELAAEATLQPLRRFDLDAAILFSDILVVPHAMGLSLRFKEGEGPLLQTVRSLDEVRALRSLKDKYEVKRVCETVALVRGRLPPGRALIGFCGAPWTVASYMIGGGSSDRVLAKIAAHQRVDWFLELVDFLVAESIEYLAAQVKAGAEVLQIFDSWAGDLRGRELEMFVLGPIARIVGGVKGKHPDVPIIVFARGIDGDHRKVAAVEGVSAVGVETEFNLSGLGNDVVVQGNLDPVALLAGTGVAVSETLKICNAVARERHIFNLGHGIRVGTDPEVVGAVVRAVRDFDG